MSTSFITSSPRPAGRLHPPPVPVPAPAPPSPREAKRLRPRALNGTVASDGGADGDVDLADAATAPLDLPPRAPLRARTASMPEPRVRPHGAMFVRIPLAATAGSNQHHHHVEPASAPPVNGHPAVNGHGHVNKNINGNGHVNGHASSNSNSSNSSSGSSSGGAVTVAEDDGMDDAASPSETLFSPPFTGAVRKNSFSGSIDGAGPLSSPLSPRKRRLSTASNPSDLSLDPDDLANHADLPDVPEAHGHGHGHGYSAMHGASVTPLLAPVDEDTSMAVDHPSRQRAASAPMHDGWRTLEGRRTWTAPARRTPMPSSDGYEDEGGDEESSPSGSVATTLVAARLDESEAEEDEDVENAEAGYIRAERIEYASLPSAVVYGTNGMSTPDGDDAGDSNTATAADADGQEAVQWIEFDPFTFIRNLPPLPKEHLTLPCRLPFKEAGSPPITLVLDLDETLVHCSTSMLPDADMVFPVDLNGQEFQVYMMKRPFLFEFLTRASELFEVVVFTASQAVYADKLLDLLDRDRKLIKHRLFRDSCVFIEGNYLKDLSVLGRDMARALIVDNSPQAFGYQIANGIPIESWYEDRKDRELMKVLEFLETIATVEDVRPHLRERFRLHDRVANAPTYQ